MAKLAVFSDEQLWPDDPTVLILDHIPKTLRWLAVYIIIALKEYDVFNPSALKPMLLHSQ